MDPTSSFFSAAAAALSPKDDIITSPVEPLSATFPPVISLGPIQGGGIGSGPSSTYAFDNIKSPLPHDDTSSGGYGSLPLGLDGSTTSGVGMRTHSVVPMSQPFASGMNTMGLTDINHGFQNAYAAGTPKAGHTSAPTMPEPSETPMRPSTQWGLSSPIAPSTVARNPLDGVIVPGYSPTAQVSLPPTPYGLFPTTAGGFSVRSSAKRPPNLGLGSSPTMRHAHRGRQVTLGHPGGSGGAGASSVPPSPLGAKRSRTSSSDTDLLTSRPLERAVSGPVTMSTSTEAGPSGLYNPQSRMVSNASVMSGVSEVLMSPHVGPQQSAEYGMLPPHFAVDGLRYPQVQTPMLDGTMSGLGSSMMVPSASYDMASAQLSSTMSGYIASPQMMQQDMVGMPMGQPSFTPNAGFSPYFQQQNTLLGPSPYPAPSRPQNLGTIQEHDYAEVETPGLDFSNTIPSQAMLPSVPSFRPYAAYPAVPGMNYAPPSSWSPDPMGMATQPGLPAPGFGRTTSFTYPAPANLPMTQSMHHRSVSAPFVPTMPPPNLPAANTLPAGAATVPLPEYDPATWNEPPEMQYSGSSTAALEPVTPTKRRPVYPVVGPRLKPGPKPKPKTPKKPKRAGDTSVPEVPSVFEPALALQTACGSTAPLPGSIPMAGSLSAPLPYSMSGDDGLPTPSPMMPGSSPLDQGATGNPRLQMEIKPRKTGPAPKTAPETIDKYYQLCVEANEYGESNRTFRCLFSACGRSFPRRSAIKAHIQTHLGDKPYQCNQCDHSFVRAHDLKRHSTTHDTEKTHKCICMQEFARSDALARHQQREICPPLRAERERRIASGLNNAVEGQGSLGGALDGLGMTMPDGSMPTYASQTSKAGPSRTTKSRAKRTKNGA